MAYRKLGRTADQRKAMLRGLVTALFQNGSIVTTETRAKEVQSIAEKIIAKAKENDVPLYKDNKLADTLSKLRIGDAIPPELYEAVAEILVFVDDMDRLKAKVDGRR